MRQKIFHLGTVLLAAFIVFLTPAVIAQTAQQNSAVVLAYYRIDEDSAPNSSLTFEHFNAHIEEIISGGYTVMALPDIIRHLKNQTALPPKTIAITFEGGYRSVLKNAVPLLESYDLPFTVFYASALAQNASDQHLSWEELHYLKGNALTSLGVSSQHYAPLPALEPQEQTRRINSSIAEHRKQFGRAPTLFSYPDGQWTPALKTTLQDSGFTAAFGIQSGSAGFETNLYALPRFTMTERYGDIERFRMVTQARALPVSDILPHGTIPATNMPQIGFTVSMPATALKPLSCFTSGQARPHITILEPSPSKSRIELRLAESLTAERTRVNCTLDQDGVLYWQGFILNQP